MSHSCAAQRCDLSVPDDDFACTAHRARIRTDTWRWMQDATTATDYLNAEHQAITEMTQPLRVAE